MPQSLPRVRRSPRAVDSDAADAIALAGAYGLKPFRWQEDVLESWLGRRADGKWAASTCGLAVSRQNGKNAIIEVRELYGAAVLGERIIHTAHQVKTAREAFLRVAGFFEDDRFPELQALVSEVRRANGQESVTLRNGGQIRFIARSGPSGRGMSIDTLILDEAQDLSEEELAALQPMISTSPNPQTILTGTPPDPDRFQRGIGAAFAKIRSIGEADRDPRLAWTDFGAKDGPIPDVDDRALWLAHNPSLAEGLISIDNIASEHSLMSPETFARERLCWWGDPSNGSGSVFPLNTWAELLDPDSQATADLTFALDVSPTRSHAAIAVAGPREDKAWHVELTSRAGQMDAREGVEWVLPRFRQLAEAFPRARVAVASNSAAASFVPALTDLGFEVSAVTGLGSACGFFYDAVMAGSVRHLGQNELTSSIRAAIRRDVGDNAFVWWRRKSSSDISALYAVTLALWQAEADRAVRLAPINNVW